MLPVFKFGESSVWVQLASGCSYGGDTWTLDRRDPWPESLEADTLAQGQKQEGPGSQGFSPVLPAYAAPFSCQRAS